MTDLPRVVPQGEHGAVRSPVALELHVHAANADARAFYRDAGFHRTATLHGGVIHAMRRHA